MKQTLALLVLLLAGSACAQDTTPAPTTEAVAPTTTTEAAAPVTTAAPTTTTTTTTTTTIPVAEPISSPQVCDYQDDDPPQELVEDFQAEVGTRVDGDWGPNSRSKQAEYCALVWEAQEMRAPLVTLRHQTYGFDIKRNTVVHGADSYQIRWGAEKPLDGAPVYELSRQMVWKVPAGETFVQVRSCSDVACSEVWSAPLSVMAGKAALERTRRTTPTTRAVTVDTTPCEIVYAAVEGLLKSYIEAGEGWKSEQLAEEAYREYPHCW